MTFGYFASTPAYTLGPSFPGGMTCWTSSTSGSLSDSWPCPGGWSSSATGSREADMLYVVGGIVAIGLLAYLVVALLRPEAFS
jgi:K+-transporting ATPase KdpF subunit